MNDMVLQAGRSAGAGASPLHAGGASPAILSGIERSLVVDAERDGCGGGIVLPRLEPALAPPCDATLLRLENAEGQPLNAPDLLSRHWHRHPYAMTIRLLRYPPRSRSAEMLDEATIGTIGSWNEFQASVERTAMRLVRDAVLGRSRGASGRDPAPPPSGLPGRLQRARRQWRNRLMTEWWSLGSSEAPLESVLAGGPLRDICWYAPEAGDRYLADPFPYRGKDTILCEEMPRRGGIGRIVAVSRLGGRLVPLVTVLEDGQHHSYPCTLAAEGRVFCVPEATERGATKVHTLEKGGQLVQVAEVAPDARLADPTLFRHQGKWWIACTDLDIGGHDNLCLLHAASPEGPWRRHAQWPVKIDIRGARPAGSVFTLKNGAGKNGTNQDRLIRPAQDCAGDYGAAIALHEVTHLSETAFHETLIGVLRPDPHGPFPDGLHTLTHDGDRFWTDGKRWVRDFGLAGEKLRRKLLPQRHGRKGS